MKLRVSHALIAGVVATTAIVWAHRSPQTTTVIPSGAVVSVDVAALCRPGYTATVRPPEQYTETLKRHQLRQEHLAGKLSDYREDHLVSLGLAGDPTSPDNLWPQPTRQSLRKDRAENRLHRLVCTGRLSLAAAQQQIRDPKNWR